MNEEFNPDDAIIYGDKYECEVGNQTFKVNARNADEACLTALRKYLNQFKGEESENVARHEVRANKIKK